MPDAHTSPINLAVAILTRRRRAMTRTEIYQADDGWADEKQVSNALYRARQAGKLDRDETGRWHLPDRKRPPADQSLSAGDKSAGTGPPVSPAERRPPAAAAGASTAAESPTSAGDAGSATPSVAESPTPDAPAGDAGTGAPEPTDDGLPDGIRRLIASLPGEALDAPLRLTSADATAALWSDGHLTIRAPDAGVELTLAPETTRTLCRYLDRLEETP